MPDHSIPRFPQHQHHRFGHRGLPRVEHVITVKLALSGTPTSVNRISASAVKADANASLIVTVAEPIPPLVRI